MNNCAFYLKSGLLKVKTLQYNKIKFFVEPLERGFAHTIGNSLRRTLISSIIGSAITKVKIQGVLHEYSIKKGMMEDVLELLLNLSKIIVKLKNKEYLTLRLFKQGPGIVTAKSFDISSDVKIINKDYKIATLINDTTLDLIVMIEKGKGFQLAKINNKLKNNIGWMNINASFSPIKSVYYTVETISYRKQYGLDKLIFYVETNGAMNAKESVQVASELLIKQFSLFSLFEYKMISKTGIMYKNKNTFFIRLLSECNLTDKLLELLRLHNFYYIGDLIQKTESELLKVHNLGKKYLKEIKLALSKKHLKLGTSISNWDSMRAEYEQYFILKY